MRGGSGSDHVTVAERLGISPVTVRFGASHGRACDATEGPDVARAIWKGRLKISEITCPVALHSVVSASDRVAFHTLDRRTGHRLQRRFIDAQTGDPVEKENQVKGYDEGDGTFVILEPDEIEALVPASDKTLTVSAFIACADIDDVYFDRPYYLGSSDRAGEEAFALIRDGMRRRGVAALATAVLFRRLRTVLIRPHGDGLIATTLSYDYEVSPVEEAFADLRDIAIEGEMLDLAKHIISTKAGPFDLSRFDDRYDAALAELVKAKIEGRKIEVHRPEPEPTTDLLAALRASARPAPGGASPPRAGAKRAAPAARAEKPAPKKRARG